MSIRDRGTKKWTSLMLPEHIQQLRKFFNEEYYHVAKPIVDEQTVEEWNLVIQDALQNCLLLRIVYHKHKQLHEVSGYVEKVDPYSQTLTVQEEGEHLLKISFHDLVHIQKI